MRTRVARLLPHRPGPNTLRGRLALVAVTAAALLMVVLTVAFNGVVRQRLQQQADDHLHTRAAAVAATVDTTGATARVVEVPHDDLLDADVWIYAGSERLEAPPAAVDGPLTRAADALAAGGGRRCVTLDSAEPVRLCTQPVPGPGPARAAVVTALGLAPYRSSADTVLYASLGLDAAMLACTYVLTRLAVGRALRPVRTMTDQATAWSALAAADRFGGSARPAELARLGTSLDALLDRIRAGLRHEQQLTRELSHELRNPLARIIAELDWWRARPRTTVETELACAAITDAAQSMRTICDTLLDDARGAGAPLPGTTEVLAVLLRLAGRSSASETVEVEAAEGLTAGVPAAVLERTVSPLLDNALRYARSSVRVVARREEGSVVVEVSDDGPGVPPAFIPDLFHPGRRADPGDGHGGAGLGLPLARRLARSADGDVRHDERHAPGARFVVTLPAG
ncbi:MULTISPECIES: sensor histidine kinase [unclassified Streptomyces]|uniref:sensor histidine kinase n=1 Tax=unclassified Streptomyces TaxID=2593676 RepID=UPI002E2D4EDC|nr:HAMP domain-containing sensor histidine kinase [Streptomyces sp. NBC_01429]